MKIWKIITLLVILTTQNFMVMAGPAYDRLIKDKAIIIAVPLNAPGLSFKNAEGKLDGFDVEMARSLAGALGVGLTLKAVDINAINQGFWNGKYDIALTSQAPSAEFDKLFDYPDYYYMRQAVIVTRHADNRVKMAEINRGILGSVKNGLYDLYLQRKLDKINVPYMPKVYNYRTAPAGFRTYNSLDDAVKELMLNNKEVDGILMSSADARNYIKNGVALRVNPEPLFSEPMVVLIDKGDEKFKEEVSKAVGRMRASGAIERLTRKWFDENFAQ